VFSCVPHFSYAVTNPPSRYRHRISRFAFPPYYFLLTQSKGREEILATKAEPFTKTIDTHKPFTALVSKFMALCTLRTHNSRTFRVIKAYLYPQTKQQTTTQLTLTQRSVAPNLRIANPFRVRLRVSWESPRKLRSGGF